MKDTFTLTIPKPCHEKWESFNPTTLGGFCNSCQKEVIDFTSWDSDRITSFFKTKKNETCGRFYPQQLKAYSASQNISKSSPWLPLSLLSLTLIFSNRSAEAQVKKPVHEKVQSNKNDRVLIGDTVRVMQVSGRVKWASDQSELPGVNVIVKGTGQGTATDENGKFSLVISNPEPTDSLEFSFIGFETQTYSIYQSEELSVYMKEDFTMLGENIVVGEAIAVSPLRSFWWRIKSLFRRD